MVTKGWFDRLFPGEDINDVLHSTIINNGVIAGYSEIMFRYLDFYTRSYDWYKWTDTLDQALVNYLFYRKKFDQISIKIELIPAGEGFLASIYNCYVPSSQQKLGLFDPQDLNVFPSLIHKFSEQKQFARNVYAQCPRLSFQMNMEQYIRGISPSDFI